MGPRDPAAREKFFQNIFAARRWAKEHVKVKEQEKAEEQKEAE